ncbi:MAG: hypothetical protein QOG43_129, partial [Actinomycetota bacterium]|nr:hypothetical protein [Actinomycetota bacterium]
RLNFAAAAPKTGLDPGPGAAGWANNPENRSRGLATGGSP